MKINAILDQIELGNYALPEFQRGYVWNRDQVKKLMNSLYRGYPIGSLLTWVTVTNPDIMRGEEVKKQGTVNLILDGQQRITSLYGIIKGHEPAFFEGDSKAFTGLYFNVETEVFEFYMQTKMQSETGWVSVTEIMQKGAGNFVEQNPEYLSYLTKLNQISNIKEIDIPIQEVTGSDKTVDIVVEIFNNVNSGGTKLSKGDLTLAKLCAEWPEARQKLRGVLEKYSCHGFEFRMEWLLRCITVYLTSQPYFSFLSTINIDKFKKALPETDKMIETILNQIGSRLGLDHDRVLQSKFAIPVIIEIIKLEGGKILDAGHWSKILYWYIHTFLWGRYSGSTESILAQDLNVLEAGGGVDGLIELMSRSRGDLRIKPEHFISWSRGSRFYPLLYMMTRMTGSIDWMSGIKLKEALLGKLASLELHHIFPKKVLYSHDYSKADVNALANYTFLTKETNISISDRKPEDYLPQIAANYPNALSSHWIPKESELWLVENYHEFMKARRELLASAANELLDGLYSSSEATVIFQVQRGDVQQQTPDIVFDSKDEDEIVLSASYWMEEKGFDSGELDYELVDEEGNLLATFDLAWPDGVQTGLSEPLALLINEPPEILRKANAAGFKFFTDIKEFMEFVESTYLVA
ncbi:MAG: DUF262 domain-containing protein [Clostridiaceae bacterium]|jgi:hypothetical protein|nr:DUF262 domain-containing protein [Clostridiaceae bacterium]